MEIGLLLLLVVTIGVVAFLLIKLYQLQSQINSRAQEFFNTWKKQELEYVRSQFWEQAQQEAGVSLERWQMESEENIRADAIRRSSAVVSGKVSEHLAPYMNTFPYNPKDARFLGTPIDLIVFDGMNDEALGDIIFLEIKSGSSSLSKRERNVRDAVMQRRIRWEEFRVGNE